MKIALAGNPNSGKTTLYNQLTGANERVGNWAGVTVAKKMAKLSNKLNPNNNDIMIVDLPGAYSMNPYTGEETVTSDFIKNENPDIIVNIVDATNLNRGLFLTTQLMELGIPVVVALNKSDLLSKQKILINTNALSQALKCPVVEITAVLADEKNGLNKLILECENRFKVKFKQSSLQIEGVKEAKTKREYRKVDRNRYAFVNELVAEVERRALSANAQNKQDKVDRIVAHKWLGIPIFVIVMFFIFSISQAWVGPLIADWLVGIMENFQNNVADLFGSASPFLSSLLVDGILGGVIAVIGFLPLIMVMFFLMALLEDCGYMARVAIVMDRFFKKIGLSGRSIIPMVIGTGCGIPGVMASRTIKNERQRRTTALITPFMPCGAKLPIIALFTGVFFSGAAWLGTAMYFLAIIIIIISALIIRKITGDDSVSYFILELPEYRIPSVKRAFTSMLSRAKGFIVKATTVILVCNATIQVMQSFTWSLQPAINPADSILASVAHPFAVLFIPLGFGVWQFAAASITGFIAKENVVGTLAVVYGISNFINPESFELVAGSADSVEAAFAISSSAAMAFLVFNLFTPPCFACIGAIRAEVNSTKWVVGAVTFQLAVGYITAFAFYQIGTLVTTGTVGQAFIPGLIVVSIMCSIIAYFMFSGSTKKVA